MTLAGGFFIAGPPGKPVPLRDTFPLTPGTCDSALQSLQVCLDPETILDDVGGPK